MTAGGRYAFGSRAKAQCPICGIVVKYRELVKDWRNQWVCPDCWDPKHPQEIQPHVTDPEALFHPRTLQDNPITYVPRRVVQQNVKYWLGDFSASVA